MFYCLDLAILGCNVSDGSMENVTKVFGKIGPRMNLSEQPLVANLQPIEAKRLLMNTRLKSCVLVVDSSTIKDGDDKQEVEEYKQLLETAMENVGKI